MVQRGIRKQFNDDIEAQKVSVAAAEWQHQAEIDKERLRYSVSWYHASSGQWLEVEVSNFQQVNSRPHPERQVIFRSCPEKPERFLDTTWGVTSRETGEFYRTEAGFIADGLTHAVWVSGGTWNFNRREHSGRYQFDHEESKIKLRQQLVTNISRLPQIFWELYQIRVSIPMIQQAFKEYQDSQG